MYDNDSNGRDARGRWEKDDVQKVSHNLKKAGGPDSGSCGSCETTRRSREGSHHDCRGYAESGAAQQRDPDRR